MELHDGRGEVIYFASLREVAAKGMINNQLCQSWNIVDPWESARGEASPFFLRICVKKESLSLVLARYLTDFKVAGACQYNRCNLVSYY